MIDMNKSRKGAALVLALIVVLVGGGMIAVIFNVVYSYAWIAMWERAGFIDHTTVVDAVQAEKAFIVKANNIEGVTMRGSPQLAVLQDSWSDAPPATLLGLDDLIIIDHANNPRNHSYNKTGTGVGRSRVEVTVFDMYFRPRWMSDEARRNPRLPPVYNMIPDSAIVNMTPEGEHIAPGTGGREGSVSNPLDRDRFGAYLIRAELFDYRDRLVRRVEGAFVQVLDP